MPHLLQMLIAAALIACGASAQDVQPGGWITPIERVQWADVSERERAVIDELLGSSHWPMRVFGLLRLDRYEGAAVAELIVPRLRDDAWQVRCFALRQAARNGVEVTVADLAEDEAEAHVLRAALRHGLEVDEDLVRRTAMVLMRTKALDELLLGIEIAAASVNQQLRNEARRRIVRIIRNMDETVATIAGRRLTFLLDLPRTPLTIDQWRAWLNEQDGRPELRVPDAVDPSTKLAPPSLVSQMDLDTFGRMLDYLDVLKQRHLEMTIVMDGTSSMLPMVTEARAGLDALILFLNDVSRTMRLAFVVYRDHDNRPVWEGHPFTTDVVAIRKFLFGLRITGGADLPEAVLEGLTACGELEWNPQAAREIILVGDAQPHPETMYKVNGLVASYRDNGIRTHVVHVPMKPPEGYALPAQAMRVIDEHNRRTASDFAAIAEYGGGRLVTLETAEQLVPAIMHLTLHEAWIPVFDEFYELYLNVCR